MAHQFCNGRVENENKRRTTGGGGWEDGQTDERGEEKEDHLDQQTSFCIIAPLHPSILSADLKSDLHVHVHHDLLHPGYPIY
jgi:hypothetical protein